MAWVRIHDGAMQHPKVLALSDSAFRLWVKSLMYCQTQLTDGLIPRAALKDMKAKRGDVERLSACIADGYAPLWETIDGFGFKVHDYLFWNDSREKVRDRQIKSKKRLDDWRAKTEAAKNGVSHTVTNGVSNGVTNATQTKPNQTKEEKKNSAPPKKPADPRVKSFLEWFPQEFTRRRFGAPYLVTWERDAPLVKQMLQVVDEPQLQRLAQVLLKTNEPFIEETDRGIGILKIKFNWLSDKLAKWDAAKAAQGEAV